MRLLLVGIAVLTAAILIPTQSVSAQGVGYGGWPYGGNNPGGSGGWPFTGNNPGGFGPGTPGSQAFGAERGLWNNVSQVCTDSQGNRVLVTNGNLTTNYTNCVSTPGSANQGCSGVATAALTPTGLGGTAVSGTLSFSGPLNGSSTVTGTLSGVAAGQTITLNIPLTAGSFPLSVAAPSGTATFSNPVTGTPASGGLVTASESNLAGSVAQGTLTANCSNTTSAATPAQGCTDSQGNRVFVRSGNPTTGYTNCAALPAGGEGELGRGFGERRWPSQGTSGAAFQNRQLCTDGQGNEVILLAANATTGYTNCTPAR
jgi:hypothetical protein